MERRNPLKSARNGEAVLDDIKVHVKFKIAALWASAMSCYIYGDFFWLYQPGKLESMLAGKIPPFGAVTQSVLLGTTVSMTIPAVMIFLSLWLKATWNRPVNMILGTLYSLFVLATMYGAWSFYLFLGSVDIILTSLIVWYAWNWPLQVET